MKNFTGKKQLAQLPFVMIIYVFIKNLLAWPGFIADYIKFKRNNDGRFTTYLHDLFPLLLDKTETTNRITLTTRPGQQGLWLKTSQNFMWILLRPYISVR
jgi:hypothetical protein